MGDFQKHWDWQLKHLQGIKRLLKQNAQHLIQIHIADETQDTQEATDMVINVEGGAIAVRVRRPREDGRIFRDLTIRSRPRGGGRTEIHKLRDGFGDYYFYAWANQDDDLQEWMLLNIHAIRASGLLDDNRKPIKNGDGTQFIEISIKELIDAGAMIAAHVELVYPLDYQRMDEETRKDDYDYLTVDDVAQWLIEAHKIQLTGLDLS